MAAPRKSMAQHVAELERWLAIGYLTGEETGADLCDMQHLSELVLAEADGRSGQRADILWADILGMRARFWPVLAPLMGENPHMTVLAALAPIIDEHNIAPGMALRWLARQQEH